MTTLIFLKGLLGYVGDSILTFTSEHRVPMKENSHIFNIQAISIGAFYKSVFVYSFISKCVICIMLCRFFLGQVCASDCIPFERMVTVSYLNPWAMQYLCYSWERLFSSFSLYKCDITWFWKNTRPKYKAEGYLCQCKADRSKCCIAIHLHYSKATHAIWGFIDKGFFRINAICTAQKSHYTPGNHYGSHF